MENRKRSMESNQDSRVIKNKSSSNKNKDIKYKNNKKKKRKKGISRVQIPSESDKEYSSKENNDESVSGLPGLPILDKLHGFRLILSHWD